MYTTPLTTLVSSLYSNHHLYADDTQLFISFHPSDFHSNISHLQNALQQICSRMTANLLTLNSSKTEFLLIGLKQQLSKIHDCSLTHSARNLGFIFDEHLTFSEKITTLYTCKSCYYHIRYLRCIRPYLNFKTASTIATSVVYSKLDYCNSLSVITFQTLNLTGSKRFKTLLLVLLLKLINPCISLPFSNIFNLHWLKVNERIEYKLLSLTYKVLTTAQPNYLHNLISQYQLLVRCHSFSPTNHHLLENHRSLILIYITSSLESTSRFIPSASPVLSRFTSSSTCQPILVQWLGYK